MMKLEKLGLYLECAGIIGLGVMAFTTENQRHKEALKRIKLEARNLRLEREIDELNKENSELQRQLDGIFEDIHNGYLF